MKKKEISNAISCNPNNGPIFGNKEADIYIANNCYEENSSYIGNDGTHGYGCHPEFRSSLFVNTAESNKDNHYRVLDYEVYCIDNYKDYIYNSCKYPDIIWEYIQTKDISENALKQFDDDIELLNDLNTIHCNDSNIRLKISKYYFKNTSEFLTNSQIVSKLYDSYLKKWLGKTKWGLIYRASEHEYTAESFHKYCDYKGPTLIIIKSSGGWIFGGYTTQSWGVKSILNAMI